MPVLAYQNNCTTIRYKLAKFHTKNGGLGNCYFERHLCRGWLGNCYFEGESAAKCSVGVRSEAGKNTIWAYRK